MGGNGTLTKNRSDYHGKRCCPTDLTAAGAWALNPWKSLISRRAFEKGLNIDNVKIVRSKLEDVRQVFKRSK